jgi:hypothetical protein
LTRFQPVGIRRQDAHGSENAGSDIGDGRADFYRRFIVTPAGDAHQTGHTLGHQIKPASRSVWPGPAEPGQRTIDQPRVQLLSIFIAQAKPFHGPKPKILN